MKVVGPLLLDSNSSRDDTNPPFQFPIWQLTNKETKRQAITKDQKNEMKAKPIECLEISVKISTQIRIDQFPVIFTSSYVQATSTNDFNLEIKTSVYVA
ncbi:hypothetical protein HKD37_18G050762 [Glycine soja]